MQTAVRFLGREPALVEHWGPSRAYEQGFRGSSPIRRSKRLMRCLVRISAFEESLCARAESLSVALVCGLQVYREDVEAGNHRRRITGPQLRAAATIGSLGVTIRVAMNGGISCWGSCWRGEHCPTLFTVLMLEPPALPTVASWSAKRR
jgi:hypothetical protein